LNKVEKKERSEIPEEEIIQVKNTKPIDFSKPYRFIYTQWWFLLISVPFSFIVVILSYLCSIFFFGVKVVDRKKVRKLMRKKGCIVMSNHCHYVDTLYASIILYPKRLYISVVQRNFEVPVARTLLRLVNCFPIPASPSGLKMITDPVGKVLKRKKHVLFMPEGNLVYLSQTIYRFKLGGFMQSYFHQAPLIPIVYVLKRRRLFGKLMPIHWIKMICVFGDPVMPPPLQEDQTIPKEELQKMSDHVANWMESTIQTYQARFKKEKISAQR
jgi:1-acyl-sn-glycerol-3-phosphate acyltransferase